MNTDNLAKCIAHTHTHTQLCIQSLDNEYFLYISSHLIVQNIVFCLFTECQAKCHSQAAMTMALFVHGDISYIHTLDICILVLRRFQRNCKINDLTREVCVINHGMPTTF